MQTTVISRRHLVLLLLVAANVQQARSASSIGGTLSTPRSTNSTTVRNIAEVLLVSTATSSSSSSASATSVSTTTSNSQQTAISGTTSTQISASLTASTRQTSAGPASSSMTTASSAGSDFCSSALASWSSKYATTSASLVAYTPHTSYVSASYIISPAQPYTTLCDKIPRAHGSGTTQLITSFPSPYTITQNVTVYPRNSEYPSSCPEKSSSTTSAEPACSSTIFGGSDPFDPSPCHVNADFLRMAYWPVEVQGDLCGNRTTVTNAVKTPRTATIWGTTVTSPAILLSFPAVSATNPCFGTVGTVMNNVVVSQNPGQIRTQCGNAHISGTVGVINFADFNSPVPASAYTCQFRCNPGYSDISGQTGLCSTIYDDFNPDVAPPSSLLALQPSWSSCSLDVYGFINDPPVALAAVTSSVNSFSLPPGSSPATSTLQAPSSTGAGSFSTPPVPGSTAAAPGSPATRSTSGIADSSRSPSLNDPGQPGQIPSPSQNQVPGQTPGSISGVMPHPSSAGVSSIPPAGGALPKQGQPASTSPAENGVQVQPISPAGNAPNLGNLILAGLGSGPSGAQSLLIPTPLSATAAGQNVAVVGGQTVSWTASSVGQTVQIADGQLFSPTALASLGTLTATASGQNVAVLSGKTLSWTASSVGQTVQIYSATVVTGTSAALTTTSSLNGLSTTTGVGPISNGAPRSYIGYVTFVFLFAVYMYIVV